MVVEKAVALFVEAQMYLTLCAIDMCKMISTSFFLTSGPASFVVENWKMTNIVIPRLQVGSK